MKERRVKQTNGVVGCLAGRYDGFRVKFSRPVSRSTGGPAPRFFSVPPLSEPSIENDVESSLRADGELQGCFVTAKKLNKMLYLGGMTIGGGEFGFVDDEEPGVSYFGTGEPCCG